MEVKKMQVLSVNCNIFILLRAAVRAQSPHTAYISTKMQYAPSYFCNYYLQPLLTFKWILIIKVMSASIHV